MVPYRAGSLKDSNSWFSVHESLSQTGERRSQSKQISLEMSAQAALTTPHLSVPPEGEPIEVQYVDG